MQGLLMRLLVWVGNTLLAGARAGLQLLWELVSDVLRGLARGVADALRQAMPWALAAIALLGTMVYVPEVLHTLLAVGIMILGIRIMFRGLIPGGKRRQR